MRPTPWQLYLNPLVFAEALEAKGVQGARARVISLTGQLAEGWSIRRTIARLEDDIQQYNVELRKAMARKLKANDYEIFGRRQGIRTCYRQLNRMRPQLRRIEDRFQRKLDRWPDLDVDESQLSTKHQYMSHKKLLLRRLKNSRRKKSIFFG